jgi:hypothetical protein
MHYDTVTPKRFANALGIKKAFAEMKKGLHLMALEIKARGSLSVFRRGGLV